jgi:DDE domain
MPDEVFVSINGRQLYDWRAVDSEGEVLDILVQPRRDLGGHRLAGDLPCHYWRSGGRPERSSTRSILLAMMKSFSCSPLIFLVLSETVA